MLDFLAPVFGENSGIFGVFHAIFSAVMHNRENAWQIPEKTREFCL